MNPSGTPGQEDSSYSVGEEDARANSSQLGSSSATSFPCPNCGKKFAREDLLRRHLVREKRAATIPRMPRQKSCNECSRSKARCDLDFPCSRCKKKGKECAYATNSVGEMRARGKNRLESSVRGVRSSTTAYQSQTHNLSLGRAEAEESDDSYASAASVGHKSPETSHHLHAIPAPHPGLIAPRPWPEVSLGASSWRAPGYTHYGSAPGSSSLQHPSITPGSGDRLHHTDPVFHPTPGYGPYMVEDGEQTPISRMVSEGLSLTGLSAPPQRYAPPARPMQVPLPAPTSRMSLYNSNSAFSSTPPTHLASSSEADAPPPSAGRPLLVHNTNNGGSNRPKLPPIVTESRGLEPAGSVQPVSARASALQVPNYMDPMQTWLEEPVMPSPLQRFGPFSSLRSALGANLFNFPLSGVELPTATEALEAHASTPTPISQATTQKDASMDVQQQQQDTSVPDLVVTQTPSMATGNLPGVGVDGTAAVSAEVALTQYGGQSDDPQYQTAAVVKHIWQLGIGEGTDLPENLARAAAAQLITYPTLMVLPEPASPVPPFMFRPWLASVRNALPASLAIARSVLAGYLVRLPASLPMIWMSIARELCNLIRVAPQMAAADDLNLFASTASLWMYLVLSLLTEEPAAAEFVDDHTVNSGLHALSTTASSLSSRVRELDLERFRARQDQLAQVEQGTTPASSLPPELDYAAWGMLETMRRTLFAAYALLVLQRLREGHEGLQAALSGVELVMDIALPCDRNTFNAASEAEWVESYTAARSRAEADLAKLGAAAGPTHRFPTLRDLLTARSQFNMGPQPTGLADTFAHADEFTNVTLAVALGLDAGSM